MQKYSVSGNHRFWRSAWLFPISFVLTLFLGHNHFSCKITGILTVPSLDNPSLLPTLPSPPTPSVSFYLSFSFFLPLSIQGSTCIAAILLESSLHCLFCFNIQMLNLNSCPFRQHVRMVRIGVVRYNFFSPLSTPCLQQPCKIAHCFAFLKHSSVYGI